MMLDFLDAADEARIVDDAVKACVKHGPKTPDMGGSARTGDVTAFVLEAIGKVL
jgi:tartrate dehydrogenase/decarboxylase/D-malate dehydrogenase